MLQTISMLTCLRFPMSPLVITSVMSHLPKSKTEQIRMLQRCVTSGAALNVNIICFVFLHHGAFCHFLPQKKKKKKYVCFLFKLNFQANKVTLNVTYWAFSFTSQSSCFPLGCFSLSDDYLPPSATVLCILFCHVDPLQGYAENMPCSHVTKLASLKLILLK